MTSAPVNDPLFEELLASTQLTPGSRTDRLVRAHGVVAGAEFLRIESLPRRVAPIVNKELLERYLKTPQGTMHLNEPQAWGLADVFQWRGLVGKIRAGGGKTLLSLLAPVVCEDFVQRPVLLVPAALKYKAEEIDIPFYRQHWRMHPNLRVLSNQLLQTPQNQKLLYRYMPDMIILDEAQEYRNKKSSARVRRLWEYKKEFPNTIIVILSATLFRKRIRDAAHLMHIALHPRPDMGLHIDLCPLPRGHHELEQWSYAVDEDVAEGRRVDPGALWRFCAPGENVQQGLQRRMNETPAIIATKQTSCDAALNIIERPAPQVPKEIVEAFRKLRELGHTPSGDELTDKKNIWRRAKELSYGFYYRWIWKDGEIDHEWLDARRSWRKHVRETIRYNRSGLDSEKLVFDAVKEHRAPGIELLEAWLEVRKRYESFPGKTPPREAVWISDYLMQDAMKFDGLIWVEHQAVGERLAKLTKLPYFTAGTEGIEKHRGACIASMASHGKGRNLQHFPKSLLLCCPAGGDIWEQLLARSHREGQTADEVSFEIYLHCMELWEAFEAARANAKFLQDLDGQEQKLSIATISTKTLDQVAMRMNSNDPLWG